MKNLIRFFKITIKTIYTVAAMSAAMPAAEAFSRPVRSGEAGEARLC